MASVFKLLGDSVGRNKGILLPPLTADQCKRPTLYRKSTLPHEGIKEVTPTLSKPSPCRGGRLHWLETGFTGNFCNENPQTAPSIE